MIQKSTSLKDKPSSELLLITVKQLFLNRELNQAAQLSKVYLCHSTPSGRLRVGWLGGVPREENLLK